MIVTETSADGLMREFKVVVDKRDIEQRIEDRLKELTKTVRMPGFRPGKVPRSLLLKRFGGTIRGEVLDDALTQTSAQALAEKDLRPAIRPTIQVTKFDDGDDLEYTMAVELMPEIEPGDFREISLTRQTVEVTDNEVSERLERLSSREKKTAPLEVDRPGRKGDALVIDFVGKLDGVAFEGGSGADHVLELGSSAFVEGFEDQLIGVRPGDRREVNVIFPKEYMNDALAGREAVFEVEVKAIQTVEPVPLDEAFATGHGFDDLAAMRAAVKEQLERDYAALSRAKLKRALLDALAEGYDFPIPVGMVDGEFDSIWRQIEEDREKQKVDPSDAGRDDDELRAEYRTIAERRVRLGLLLSEVGRLNNITVESDEMQRAVMERARAFPGQESKVIEHYRAHPEALAELRAPMLEDKVVDFIFEMADITDETVPAEELMRDAGEAGGAGENDVDAAWTAGPK